MRKCWIVLLMMFVAVLVGCAGSDFLMGTETDAQGNTKQKEGPAPINILGGLLGFAEAAAVARWVYTEARVRKVDKNFAAVVAGVETAIEKKKIDKDALYPAITAASEIYANRGFFAKSVKKIKDAVRSDRAGKRILNS